MVQQLAILIFSAVNVPVFTGYFFCNLRCSVNRLIVNAILFFIQKNTNNQFTIHSMSYLVVTSAKLIAGVLDDYFDFRL